MEAGDAANPADPAPRQALLRFLLEQKRFDEAFNLTEASLKVRAQRREPADRSGASGAATRQCGRSVGQLESGAEDRVPAGLLAHLYLAHELDREGKADEAAEHYWNYLQKIGTTA